MPAVTITAVDTIQLSIPLDTWAPPPMFAGKPRTHVEAIYVRVTCSNGIVGWGESFGSSGAIVIAAFDKWVRQLAVGKNPADQSLMPSIERLLHGLGRAGPVMHALSGLDIALWDIRGKLEGVPVCTLLGMLLRRRSPKFSDLHKHLSLLGLGLESGSPLLEKE